MGTLGDVSGCPALCATCPHKPLVSTVAEHTRIRMIAPRNIRYRVLVPGQRRCLHV